VRGEEEGKNRSGTDFGSTPVERFEGGKKEEEGGRTEGRTKLLNRNVDISFVTPPILKEKVQT